MPAWIDSIRAHYASRASAQFVLYGNTEDLYPLVLPADKPMGDPQPRLLGLQDYLGHELLTGFAVLVVYSPASGIQLLRGKEHLRQWTELSRLSAVENHRQAVEALKVMFLFLDHLSLQLGKPISVACIVEHAELVAPQDGSRLQQDLGITAAIIRSWSQPSLNEAFTLTSFLLARNLTELHSLITQNPRTALLELPMPSPEDLLAELRRDPVYELPLAAYKDDLPGLAQRLSGVSLQGLVQMLRLEAHARRSIDGKSLLELRKRLVERQAGGSQDGRRVIEFLQSDKTLDQLTGQEHLVDLLRQDLSLLRAGRHALCPMGYLLSAPVGCGKNHLVECLAGEAGIPVVVINNFRDRWVGSTEGNVEAIFRLIRALGQCFVFVDEADQTLGKRDSGGDGGGGVDGRVYSMFASFMGDARNQGRVIWLLASSRPDKIEVDFKRPGRLDTKLPIFPSLSAESGYGLLRAMAKGRGAVLPEALPADLAVPDLLTPGAAKAIVGQLARSLALRQGRGEPADPLDALRTLLANYAPPVPLATLAFQMQLAIQETTDATLIPQAALLKVAEYLSAR